MSKALLHIFYCYLIELNLIGNSVESGQKIIFIRALINLLDIHQFASRSFKLLQICEQASCFKQVLEIRKQDYLIDRMSALISTTTLKTAKRIEKRKNIKNLSMTMAHIFK
jgi:hypothetical protein